MPAPLAVDREQVRMLVLAVGVTEASRQTGIDLSTVKQWSSRGKWLAHCRPAPPVMPKSMQPVTVSGVTTVTNPVTALENTLLERKNETRLGLSKWTSKAAKKLGEMEDEEAMASHQVAVSVASVHAKMNPEQQAAGSAVLVNISLIGMRLEADPMAGTGQDCTDI